MSSSSGNRTSNNNRYTQNEQVSSNQINSGGGSGGSGSGSDSCISGMTVRWYVDVSSDVIGNPSQDGRIYVMFGR